MPDRANILSTSLKRQKPHTSKRKPKWPLAGIMNMKKKSHARRLKEPQLTVIALRPPGCTPNRAAAADLLYIIDTLGALSGASQGLYIQPQKTATRKNCVLPPLHAIPTRRHSSPKDLYEGILRAGTNTTARGQERWLNDP